MRELQERKLRVEQERLLSTPRKFKKSDKLKALPALQLFMLVHLLAGPAIIIASLFLATVVLAGSTVSGTVTDLRVMQDDESTSYDVKYDYTFNNRTYHTSGHTNKNRFYQLKTGDSVTVKVLPALPEYGAQLIDGNAQLPSIAFMSFFGLGWTVIMLMPLNMVYIAPYRRTNVMRNGKVCLGKITDKSLSGEDNTNCSICFQYEPRPGQYRTERREVSHSQFKVAQIGETVTVLYDPEYLDHSLMYRYSDYELID